MDSKTRICKICGKEYPYCHTITNDAFRWQDVACCKEHAAKYFEKIAISRGEKPAKKSEPKVEAAPVVEIEVKEEVGESNDTADIPKKWKYNKHKDAE